MKAAKLLIVGLLCYGCGILRERVLVSGPLSSVPTEANLVAALRADEEVRKVYVEDKFVYAELNRPRDREVPESMAVVVVEAKNESGKGATLQLYMLWEGLGPVGSEQEMWEELLKGLRDRLIDRCENWPVR